MLAASLADPRRCELLQAASEERVLSRTTSSTCPTWTSGCATTAALSGTDAAAEEAERVIRDVAAEYGAAKSGSKGGTAEVLQSVSTFTGAGAPRFWFSVTPEQQQQNYAQLIVRVRDKEDTPRLVGAMQNALSQRVPGASIDVHQLQTNPVQYPIAVRISSVVAPGSSEQQTDIRTLRMLADQVKAILSTSPHAQRVRDDWGDETLTVQLSIDPDRAEPGRRDESGRSRVFRRGDQRHAGIDAARRREADPDHPAHAPDRARAAVRPAGPVRVRYGGHEQDPAATGRHGRLWHADGANPAPGPRPGDHGVRVSAPGHAGLGSVRSGTQRRSRRCRTRRRPATGW